MDIPEFGFAMLTGSGPVGGTGFTQVLQALYLVSYGAHFLVKKLRGEGHSIAGLHQAIAAAGYRPRGRHHEVYLSDPRRSAPQKLGTILRQPIEPPASISSPPAMRRTEDEKEM